MKRINYLPLIFMLLVLCNGCNSNSRDKIVEVDLSSHEPISLESSNKDPDKLYVAVSTMISPLETFNLYKDLIDHIAEEINQTTEDL